MVSALRKCFSKRFISGMGNRLESYTASRSAIIIKRKFSCTKHLILCVPRPRSTYFCPANSK
ncbi:hypothetical protein BpHYR1_038047 [Brachionus plicatilis]|uniref:Uncharacterized protein n=1 Tax=Brachionus plicatilis TaxID=10195 RepID=A0A3M7P461_BRAPC|nr:hypothetical protein BpHYR1_038047 [Brachionus plicatilis]